MAQDKAVGTDIPGNERDHIYGAPVGERVKKEMRISSWCPSSGENTSEYLADIVLFPWKQQVQNNLPCRRRTTSKPQNLQKGLEIIEQN